MQDQYIGQAGTFMIDPDQGVRVPLEQYQAEQVAKEQRQQALLKLPPDTKKPSRPLSDTGAPSTLTEESN